MPTMKAAAWKVKSYGYVNGKVLVKSGASWDTCEHKDTKRVDSKWISHKSIPIPGAGIFNIQVISVIKTGYTVWCRDCNKVMGVKGG